MTDGQQSYDASHGGPAPHAQPTPDADNVAPATVTRRPRWPGALAGGLAILTVILDAAGLIVATTNAYDATLALGLLAMLASVLAIAAGIVALIGNWGRGWATAAIVVATLLNPLVLLHTLRLLGGL